MTHRIEVVAGEALLPWLHDAARLRIEVFRDFPYLYDGDVKYELNYLQHYAESTQSVFVLAIAEGHVVGMSTGIPLLQADEAFGAPFREHQMDPEKVFYFGESVLSSAWRGRGIGHSFFNEREKFAHAQGFTITAFCAVDRAPDHPARPAEYRPLDDFWRGRGYTRRPGLVVQFPWKETGSPTEQLNTLTFWTRELGTMTNAPADQPPS